MKFRTARHTNKLEILIQFYCDVLNFEVLGSFKDHNNYSGVFLGKSNLDWHLEFTQSDSKAKQIFDEDDALVFYPDSIKEYNAILKNIESLQVKIIEPKNPYWKVNGLVIEDPDNYKVIISIQKDKQRD